MSDSPVDRAGLGRERRFWFVLNSKDAQPAVPRVPVGNLRPGQRDGTGTLPPKRPNVATTEEQTA